MIPATELEKFLNTFLNINKFDDYAPNGLQIAGIPNIQKIIVGVSASQDLIDYALYARAQAIIVHHGYFWKGENRVLQGMNATRIRSIMEGDLNLFAYHLPLDAHQEIGNNVLLAKALGLQKIQPIHANPLLFTGVFQLPITYETLLQKLAFLLQRKPLYLGNKLKLIRNVAISTGAAQDFISEAIHQNADAFITGESSERTYYIAKEENIHFFAAGHHATETFGIQSIGLLLHKLYDLDVEFYDSKNPL